MDDIRKRHVESMSRELEYLYELLDGSESKAEKLVVQKQAEKLYKHLMLEKSKLDAST